MNQKTYLNVFPTKAAVMMVALLSLFVLGSAHPSFAASAKKKTPAVERLSAVEHTEARIKQLQAALKITADQEVAWNNLAQVMRDNAKEMDAFSKERSENSKTMNSVERMKMHSQYTEATLAQQKKLIPVFEALYTSLSDEQKIVTDSIFRTGKHGKHKIN